MMWGDMADSREIQAKVEGVYSNLETVKVEDLAYKMPRLDQL